jgi:hypothetical protein
MIQKGAGSRRDYPKTIAQCVLLRQDILDVWIIVLCHLFHSMKEIVHFFPGAPSGGGKNTGSKAHVSIILWI